MSIALRLKITVLLASSLIGFTATPAFASERSFQSMIYAFGECLARSHRSEARRLIFSKDLWRDVEGKIIFKAPFECDRSFDGPPEVSFFKDAYVYSLALGLVRSEFSTTEPEEFASVAPLSQPVLPIQPRPATSAKSAGVAKMLFTVARWRAHYGRIAECAARAAPMPARRWLNASYESAEDERSFLAMMPVFESCRAQLGFSVPLDAFQLKGPLALNYYRLAHLKLEQAGGALK